MPMRRNFIDISYKALNMVETELRYYAGVFVVLMAMSVTRHLTSIRHIFFVISIKRQKRLNYLSE